MDRAAAIAIGAAAQVDSKPIIQAGAQVLVTSVMQQLAPLIALLVVVAFLYLYWTSTQSRNDKKADINVDDEKPNKQDTKTEPVEAVKQTASDLQ